MILDVILNKRNYQIAVTFEEFIEGGGGGGGEIYHGPYEVTPRVYSQSLETKNKLLEKNVSIKEIPITYVSNPQGGQTTTIG